MRQLLFLAELSEHYDHFSRSIDGHIYVWHRRTGVLFEILGGHDPGGVNSVDWCPREDGIFASCGDDCTIRIWGPEPTSGLDGIVEKSSRLRDVSNGDLDNGRAVGSKPRDEQSVSSPTRARATSPR